MIVNTAQGGGSLPLNLHVQPDEPQVKEGLWIKAPAKETVKQITTKDTFVIGGSFAKSSAVLWDNVANLNFYFVRQDDFIYYLSIGYDYTSSLYKVNFYMNRYNIVTSTLETVLICSDSNTVSSPISRDNGCCFYIENNKAKFALHYEYGRRYMNVGGTLDLSDFKTITNTSSSMGDIPNNADVIYVGQDDEKIYSLQSYLYGTNTYRKSLYVLDTETNTSQYLSQITNSANNIGIYGILIDGVIFYAEHASNVLHALNVSDRTETTITMPVPAVIDNSYTHWEVYQNCLYMYATNAILVFNLITKTFRQIPVENPPVTISALYALFVDPYKNKLLCTFNGPVVFDYNFESESLPENTLAVLDGAKYDIKLIASKAMNFLRTIFNDVWWYDTDFKEYPTYIGNGTSFTKIKN